MPLHAQCKVILDQIAAAGQPPLEQLPIADARAQFAAGLEARKAMSGPAQEMARVEDRAIEVPGHAVPVRIYWPSNQKNLPVLIYYHGGGWVLGDLEMVDRPCRALANASQCVVISVDYPLAPEYKFPVPAEDSYRVVEYVAAHAGELGIDPKRIAVGGDSAGGNLATVVSIMSRDRGGPRLAFQLLVYPVTNHGDDHPSMSEHDGVFLSRAGMEWFWQHYLLRPEDGQNPYASPLKSQDLSGLPPAFLITAECDPLRDQGEAYAQRLKEAGVTVEMKRYDGAIHAFFHMAAAVDSGREAVNDAARALRDALGVTRETAA